MQKRCTAERLRRRATADGAEGEAVREVGLLTLWFRDNPVEMLRRSAGVGIGGDGPTKVEH